MDNFETILKTALSEFHQELKVEMENMKQEFHQELKSEIENLRQ